jgi:hypothetical protein
MPMPIQLPEAMEKVVRFVEDTSPQAVVAATVDRLKAGDSPRGLLAAAALAVSRSTELPIEHHGGPIHPVSGIHAIFQSSTWLDGDWGLMPIVQSVALANKHIHSPYMGPAIMAALPSDTSDLSTIAREQAFSAAVRDLQPVSAERHLLVLLETHSPAQILELMCETAIHRNGFDDHYFLYVVHAVRALDSIGHEWAHVVLRPAVRFLSNKMQTVGTGAEEGHPRFVAKLALYHRFTSLTELIERYKIVPEQLQVETDESETDAVIALGEEIGKSTQLTPISQMLARGLAEGLSLLGVAEALSYGGALLHLRTDYGNPFDVHLHTGMNARRYVLSLDAISARNKVLALLSWPLGREIQLTQDRIIWSARNKPDARLADLDEEQLLDALTESITGRPAPDLDAVDGHVERLHCGPKVRETMALAQVYAERKFDAGRFFQRMGEVVCRDDFSEMHAFKHLQSAKEEYQAMRTPLGWAHIVSTAKMAWCTYGHAQDVYQQATEHLAV